jgi:hypothetical protein
MLNSKIEDLLIEFDEMGYVPTTLSEKSPEDEALNFKNRLHQEIENAVKEAETKSDFATAINILSSKSVDIGLFQQCCDVESHNDYYISKYGICNAVKRRLLSEEEFKFLKKVIESVLVVFNN